MTGAIKYALARATGGGKRNVLRAAVGIDGTTPFIPKASVAGAAAIQNQFMDAQGLNQSGNQDSFAEAIAGSMAHSNGDTQERVEPATRAAGIRPADTEAKFVADLQRHEGFDATPRIDEQSDDKPLTLGPGLTNITNEEWAMMRSSPEAAERDGVTPAQTAPVLEKRIMENRIAIENDSTVGPIYAGLSPERKAIIDNMQYNLGLPRLKQFVNMWDALAKGDFRLAGAEMLDSKWHRQVGSRARELALEMMQGGPSNNTVSEN
jgi:hypothetical protein